MEKPVKMWSKKLLFWTKWPKWKQILFFWHFLMGRSALTVHALAALSGYKDAYQLLEELKEDPSLRGFVCTTIQAPVWELDGDLIRNYEAHRGDPAQWNSWHQSGNVTSWEWESYDRSNDDYNEHGFNRECNDEELACNLYIAGEMAKNVVMLERYPYPKYKGLENWTGLKTTGLSSNETKQLLGFLADPQKAARCIALGGDY